MNHSLSDRHARTRALLHALSQRILVLDGAMGTMIQRYHLTEEEYRGARFAAWKSDLRGNNDLLTLTRPQVIHEIHAQYLTAGADILETNTFNSTTVSMADYHMESLAYELNFEGARLAREVADAQTLATPLQPRFVAGVLGPMNRTLSLSPDVNDPGFRAVNFDEVKDAYREATRGLIDGGADILLIETIFDTLNSKAAIFAIEEEFDARGLAPELRPPIMISGTITDASGRTLSGQVVEAFYNSVRHANPISIGFNCALGAKELRPHIEELARIADCRVSAHPNAGLPNAMAEYDELPSETAAFIREWATSGWLNITGGCCGTTPAHIKAIAEIVATLAPRVVPEVERRLRLSGLEPVNIGDDSLFVNVGERTNVTGSSPASRKRLSTSGTTRGANGATISAIALICAGVVPQQPPVTLSQPLVAHSRMNAAVSEGSSSYSAIALGSPAFGCAETRQSAMRASSSICGRNSFAPSAQLKPIEIGLAWRTEL